eukprot:2310084-Pleurochrysis_carterae.AAC.3
MQQGCRTTSDVHVARDLLRADKWLIVGQYTDHTLTHGRVVGKLTRLPEMRDMVVLKGEEFFAGRRKMSSI